MPDTNQPTEPANTLPLENDRKKELELEKLAHEVKDLKRFWLFKPQYVSAILPTIAAFTSVIILIANSRYDVKTQLLQLKRDKLELEVARFSDSTRAFEIKKKELDNKENDVKLLKDEISALIGPINANIPDGSVTKQNVEKLKILVYKLQDQVSEYQTKMDIAEIRSENLLDSIKLLKRQK